MKKVLRDFMWKEARRLALCGLGLAACLLVLARCSPGLASRRLWLALGIPAVIGLAALRSALLARAGAGGLTDQDIYLLEREYAGPHPVYRVWQGEVHLTESFLICRSRGRLLFLPLHRIERVERRFNRTAIGRIPLARFILDNGKSVAIGFSPNHSRDSEAVFLWLASRLGPS